MTRNILDATDDDDDVCQVAKAASTSLNNCVNCLPGLREVDQMVKHVSTICIKLTNTAQVCLRIQYCRCCFVVLNVFWFSLVLVRTDVTSLVRCLSCFHYYNFLNYIQ